MAGMLIDYTFKGTNGDYYTGQVVADPTVKAFAYQPGAVYSVQGGTYTMGTTQTPTNAPVGSVYQLTYYDAASNKLYDSYHYSPKNNAYYDVNVTGYDKTTGTYTPPGTTTPISMWSSKLGLTSEYGYIKDTAGNLHAYGGGGSAYAQITPSTTGLTVYDYKFLYTDGSYYLGRVVDDGTFGYKVGGTYTKGDGTYQIFAVDPSKPDAGALAGYCYVADYVENGTHYAPSELVSTSPYYQKPVGYGGIGTETDYIQKPGGYYQFSNAAESSKSTPLTAVPLPT